MSTALGLASLLGSAVSGALANNSAKQAEQDAYNRQVMLNLQQQYFNQVNMKKQNDYNTKNAKTEYQRQLNLLKIENDFNKRMADEQFARNSYLAQHAHQFEVEDLIKSGLNPILSANQGTQASVGMPSSAQGGVESSRVGLPSSNAGSATAFNRGELMLQGVNAFTNAIAQNSQAELNSASAHKFEEEALTESNKRMNLSADTDLKASQTLLTDVEKELKDKDLEYSDREHLMGLKSQLEDINYKQKMATAATMSASANQQMAKAHELDAQTKQLEYKLSKQQYDNNPYVKWNQLHPSASSWTAGIGRWTGAFGQVFGGNVGLGVNYKK